MFSQNITSPLKVKPNSLTKHLIPPTSPRAYKKPYIEDI